MMHLPSGAGLQLRPLSLVVLVGGYFSYALRLTNDCKLTDTVDPVNTLGEKISMMRSATQDSHR
jgi:hypothetical protein